MHTEQRSTTATVDQVWAVIADGWTYPCWVVGASRMRAVSADWPAAGAVPMDEWTVFRLTDDALERFAADRRA